MNQENQEPAIHGIPNATGFGCWFAALTQCLFRKPEIREAILNFDPESLHLDLEASSGSIDAITTFKYLKEHFLALMECEDTLLNPQLKITPEKEHKLDNTKLLESLRLSGEQFWTRTKNSGYDSRAGLDALCEMFSNIGQVNPNSFNKISSPLKDFLFIDQKKIDTCHSSPYLYVSSTFEAAVLSQIENCLYLPKYIVLSVQKHNKDLLNPPKELNLPEPFDFILSDKNIENCSTKVHYSVWAYVLYLNEKGEHAISLVNTKNAGWVLFDDLSTKQFDIKSVHFTNMFWPPLIFYSRDE